MSPATRASTAASGSAPNTVSRPIYLKKLIHELGAGVRYTRGSRFVRRRMLGGQTISAGLAGYLRTSVMDSRLIDTVTDSVFGGAADISYSFVEFARVQGWYEFARDSQIFLPHLSTFHRVRIALEARF
jgi:hypothetical protein